MKTTTIAWMRPSSIPEQANRQIGWQRAVVHHDCVFVFCIKSYRYGKVTAGWLPEDGKHYWRWHHSRATQPAVLRKSAHSRAVGSSQADRMAMLHRRGDHVRSSTGGTYQVPGCAFTAPATTKGTWQSPRRTSVGGGLIAWSPENLH